MTQVGKEQDMDTDFGSESSFGCATQSVCVFVCVLCVCICVCIYPFLGEIFFSPSSVLISIARYLDFNKFKVKVVT